MLSPVLVLFSTGLIYLHNDHIWEGNPQQVVFVGVTQSGRLNGRIRMEFGIQMDIQLYLQILGLANTFRRSISWDIRDGSRICPMGNQY